MPEIRLCATEQDEEHTLAIYNAVWPTSAVTMDEVHSFKSQTLDYGDFLGPGGSAAIALMPQRPGTGFVLLTVLPEHRRRGVGSALYLSASDWLRKRGINRIEARVSEDDEESIAFAGRRGFEEVERNRRMVLDLTTLSPPPIEPPAGIEIVTWAERLDLARGIYDVACEAFPDVPGAEEEVMEPFDDWLPHEMQGSGDLPEATFIALAGTEVVGYSKFSLTAAQPTTANHDMTGVKRAWRGRGIAGALKRAQIAWAQAGLRAPRDAERAQERADSSSQRAARIPRGPGPHRRPRATCGEGMMLVLFDVDKTLFMSSDPLMGRATTEAIEAVWGRRLADDAIKYVDHPGQTATRITRLLLRAEGLSDDEIDGGMDEWCREASARYLELLSRADTSEWRAAEGAAEAIAQIERRALLTGNPEPVARARMERIGLASFFPAGQGAFGCEAEERAELIAIARHKAGDWPAEKTVAVGDTEADIEGARRAGIHVIGFGAGLEGADAVIEKMSELPGVLARLEN